MSQLLHGSFLQGTQSLQTKQTSTCRCGKVSLRRTNKQAARAQAVAEADQTFHVPSRVKGVRFHGKSPEVMSRVTKTAHVNAIRCDIKYVDEV